MAACTITSEIISADCSGTTTWSTGNITINSGVTVSDYIININNAVGTFVNNGILFGSPPALYNVLGGSITEIINNGTIGSTSGNRLAIYNVFNSTITKLTNNGTLIGGNPFYGAIYNYFDSAIQTFNNVQGRGNVNGAVVYNGVLPSYYNIIIRSPSQYGQLASGTFDPVAGQTTFGIYAGGVAGVAASTVAAGTYTSVLTGLSASNLINTTGTYANYDFTLSLQSGSSTIWDLIIALRGPSAEDTQISLASNASALQGIYNLQSSIINNGLSYDCALFDVHGLCLSTGGRYSNTNTPTGDSAGALVIGAYRLNDQVRVGVYLDQGGVSNSLPSGLDLKQGNPLFGAFAVWQANQDGLGAQIKLATGYDEAKLSVTRAVVGTSEAGTGTTELSSQALSLVGSYGFEMQGGWLATPYAGLRRSQVKADGYTESDAIDAPLTYEKLKQAATTLQLGVKVSTNLSSQLAINGSLGIEHDIHNNQGVYSASGVDNLTAIVFNSNINKTRPVASLGAILNVDNRQQLAFNLMYREEAFSHSSSTSAYGTYTIGF
jgi:outer membrane autotransporter protein